MFQSRIHINGDFIIGTYGTEYEAAIAYNKAADMLEPVFPVSYTRNYIEDISISLGGVETRYIRVTAKGIGKCPDNHVRPGQEARVHFDEVMIE